MAVYKVTVTGYGKTGWQDIGTITAPGSLDAFTTSTFTLSAGFEYRAFISGTVDPGSMNIDESDAEWGILAGNPVSPVKFWRSEGGVSLTLVSEGYQSDHVYEYSVSGSGTIGFKYFDSGNYANNVGFLGLRIQEMTYTDAFFDFNSQGQTAHGASKGIQMQGNNVPLSLAYPPYYNPAHQYTFFMTGQGIKETFQYLDTDYTENEGNLTVCVEGEFA